MRIEFWVGGSVVCLFSLILTIWMVVTILKNRKTIEGLKREVESLWIATKDCNKDNGKLLIKQKELEARIKELEGK